MNYAASSLATQPDEFQASSPYHITLAAPLFWLGALLFFINKQADAVHNIPAGEIILFGMMCLGFLRCHGALRQTAGLIAVLLAFALCFWAGAMEVVNLGAAGDPIRTIIKLLVFYGLFSGYSLLPDKTALLTTACGFLCGYVADGMIQGAIMLTTQPESSHYLLKYILPNPATVLLAGWFFRRFHSRAITAYLLVGVVITLLLTFPANSRTALLAIPLGYCFYTLVKFVKMPTFIWTTLILAFPMIPIIVVGSMYQPDNMVQIGQWFFEQGLATLSNVERTLMIHASITALRTDPITGVPLHEFISYFGATYMWLMQQSAVAAESPHQYYLELAVPYGIPAAVMAMVMFALIIRLAVRACGALGMRPEVVAFIFGALALLLLSGPISGVRRFDILLAVFYITAGLRNLKTHDNEDYEPNHHPH